MDDIIEEVPRNQRYNCVLIKKDNNILRIEVKKPSFDFRDIMPMRNDTDPKLIKKNLISNGHLFSSIGVSTILTITIDSNDYLILVNHGGKFFEKIILTLVSGYIEEENILDPKKAILQEIAEELLFFAKEEKLIRYKKDNSYLPRPFNKIYSDSLLYAELINGDKFNWPFKPMKIFINGKQTEENSNIFYESFYNNVLIAFNYHIVLTKEIMDSLYEIYHAENLAGGETLKTKLYPDGVYLAKIIDKKLNGEIYQFKKRELIRLNPGNFILFSSFACGSDTIKSKKFIDFLEYVSNQSKKQCAIHT